MRCISSLILLSLGLAVAGCGRGPEKRAEEPRDESQPVEATWYNVPPDSLAKRRAGEVELTAATDHYKLGTLLRVTRVSNGEQVTVRVTDTGLRASKSRIDLCKEAAEQLEMVSDGVASVRLAELPPDEGKAATIAPRR